MDGTPARSLTALREDAASCRRCELWREASQTVFGEGPSEARIMLVGEQPGDREDRAGKPFVGPASRELDRALEAAGIERHDAYLTNVVKHFKFEERAGRRIHQTPKRFEVEACKPWLEEELRLLEPEALIVLGATAAKALFGSSFRVTHHRGELLDSELAPIVAATMHPSAILRGADEEREDRREALVEDLRVVVRALAERG